MPFLDPQVGCLSAGDDILSEPRKLRVEEAMVEAANLPNCKGFTYKGAVDATEEVCIYFKSAWNFQPHKREWTTVAYHNFEDMDRTGPSHKRMVAIFDYDNFFPVRDSGENRIDSFGGEQRVQRLSDIVGRLVRLGVRCLLTTLNTQQSVISEAMVSLKLHSGFVSKSGALRVIPKGQSVGNSVKTYLEARNVLEYDALFISNSDVDCRDVLSHVPRITIFQAAEQRLENIAMHFKSLRPVEGPYTVIFFLKSLSAQKTISYEVGDTVEYYSQSQQIWVYAKVNTVHSQGVDLDVKPGYILQGFELREKLRPHGSSQQAELERTTSECVGFGDEARIKMLTTMCDTLRWMGVKIYVVTENNHLRHECEQIPELKEYLLKPNRVFVTLGITEGQPGTVRLPKCEAVNQIIQETSDSENNILYVGCVAEDIKRIRDECRIATMYCDALETDGAAAVIGHFQARIHNMQRDDDCGTW